MKSLNFKIASTLLFLSVFQVSFAQMAGISGKVFSATGPVEHAIIALTSVSFSTMTDSIGRYNIQNIPAGSYRIQASCIGYEVFERSITLKAGENARINFTLVSNEVMLDNVVITGVTRATRIKENPTPTISISAKTLEKNNESNIIDALVKNAPGLTAVKTGPNISKPFIRGLGYNRVLTLYDGVRQEGQQWGDEHGIEVDAYNIELAEVIKGPAGIMYGSDALAGVVSLFPHFPKEKDGIYRGRIISEYQSNNGLIGNGLRLGRGGEHWLWEVRLAERIAKNYNNAVDGRVYNTGFNEKNASALLGHTSSKGYTHFNMTLYDNVQGIPDGSRDSLTRKFTEQVYEGALDTLKNRPFVSETRLNSYSLSPLHQHIQHYRAYTNHHYELGKGDINASIGVSQNIRREYNHPTKPDQAGMYVRLNTFNYRLSYNAPATSHVDVSLGVNGMYQDNKIKDATDFPIPDYKLVEASPFLFIKFKSSRWVLAGGASYDFRSIHTYDLYFKTGTDNFKHRVFSADTVGAVRQFERLQLTFSGISLSLGSTYKISDRISIKANLAKGYRAPNIAEMVSNGLDPGAHIVYIGNRNFAPEYNFQQDLGIIADFRDASATLSIFNNNISNYIYLTEVVDQDGKPLILVQGNKTFQYQQAKAQLYGAEATLNFHPSFIKGFTINNNFGMTFGYNKSQKFKNQGILGKYLPFIPPLRLLSSITQEIQTRSRSVPTLSVKLEAEMNSAQNRYLALYHTETATSEYTLFNIGVAADLQLIRNNKIQLQFQANNLFNTIYQSNLSRLKYFEYYTHAPTGYMGIYGMGRNICVKLIFPF